MVDFKAIEEKWNKRWQQAKLFESHVKQGQKKYFLSFPYPYMNGYLHLGHFYTMMRVDAFARYKRLTGHNVLFPQGWHCTGSPIESVAKRIREGEPKQIENMRKQGFTDEEIKRFSDPTYWTEFFPKKGMEDFLSLGMSIDPRRSFITTSINPRYDRFIAWQFRKLKDGGFVVKGNHPVVWCPKDEMPVGDHDRVKGEGETPQEYVLMKYPLKGEETIIVTSTLRPETVFADTNIWINPGSMYVRALVDSEEWIVSKECVQKLRDQEKSVVIKEELEGRALVGKICVAPMTGKELLILPASFCDPKIGTGIVRSVPAHAPFDCIALMYLQQNREAIEGFGIAQERIKGIEPISLIAVDGFGEFPAMEICKQMKIHSLEQKDLLEDATKEIYKKEFHTGIMKALALDYAGMNVEKAKREVRAHLLKEKSAEILYELTGDVVCRCLTPAGVKIVRDQWFMNYSNVEWKKTAHEALDSMRLYPEKGRQQFNYVLDWLTDWACVREYGLGTRLPWDEKWVIEALSDSTIYMAYYTIAHIIEKMNPDDINDELFNYVFRGEGESKSELWKEMKREFDYWYPLDFRNSGKDLIQNHLSFCIFNHTALFPKKHWPKSFGLNGWVTVNGEKMSKSLGNFIVLRDLIRDAPIDASRITILSGGEGLDDPNWDSEFARTIPQKLDAISEMISEHYGKGRDTIIPSDKWMESQMNLLIIEAQKAMEETMFRTALQHIFFDFPKMMRQYLRKTANSPNKALFTAACEAQIVMLSPFASFIAEEMWGSIGKEGFVASAHWPKGDESKVDKIAIYLDAMIAQTRRDIDAVTKLAKIEKPKKVTLFLSNSWKYGFISSVREHLAITRNVGDVLKAVMATDLKQHGKEITKLLPRMINTPALIPQVEFTKEQEKAAIEDALAILREEVGCEIVLEDADSSEHPKAQQALPAKLAIVVE